MKTKLLVGLFVISISSLFVISCEDDEILAVPDFMYVDENGHTSFHTHILKQHIYNMPVEPVSQYEQSILIRLREEEKLMNNVYEQFSFKWSYSIFEHIANCEQTHGDVLLILFERYNIADPSDDLGMGKFSVQELQDIYDEAMQRSTATEALMLGAGIEEMNIVRLRNALRQVDSQDIKFVIEQLSIASRNHLRATVKVLGKFGVSYVPQYLSHKDFDIIMYHNFEHGNR